MKKEEQKMKKALSIVLIAGLLAGAAAGVAGAADNGYDAPQNLPYYLYVTGTVISSDETEDGFRIQIEDENGNPSTLVTSWKTVFPFDSEVKEGGTVTGYYLANAPMITIWPAQYTIAVLAIGAPTDLCLCVDRFYAMEDREGWMLNMGGNLAFQIGESTEVVLANGDDFKDGHIEGRRMIVIYGPSTRSYPALTMAIKVIVLYEDAVTGPEPIPEWMLGGSVIDAAGWPIIVDGEQIVAPAAFQTEDGIVMVPVRAVAEALGYDVNWDHEAKSVRLGAAIHLWIGNDEVHFGRMAPIIISTAPQIVDGSTYVPLDFFRTVLGLPNAFAFEGQIEIHSVGEAME